MPQAAKSGVKPVNSFWPSLPEPKTVQAEVPEQVAQDLASHVRRFWSAMKIVLASHNDTRWLSGITTALDLAMMRMPVIWQREHKKLAPAAEVLEKIEEDIQRLSQDVKAFQELMGTSPKWGRARPDPGARVARPAPKPPSPAGRGKENGDPAPSDAA